MRAWEADPRELLRELYSPYTSRTAETEEGKI